MLTIYIPTIVPRRMDGIVTIREQIARKIRYDVIFGRLQEGQPLREQDLARRFGVSRGPIRDALLQLSKEGLLVAEPNRGVRVARRSQSESRDLLVDLRRRIEAHALRQVMRDLQPAQIEQWEALLEQFKRACATEVLEDVVELDIAFHRALVSATGDAKLIAVWTPIITDMWLPYARHKSLMESYEEHARILAAIKAGKLKVALEELRANIQ